MKHYQLIDKLLSTPLSLLTLRCPICLCTFVLTNRITGGVFADTDVKASHKDGMIMVDLVFEGSLPLTEVVERVVCTMPNTQSFLQVTKQK